MKRKILFATLVACAGLFFSACQDEEVKIADVPDGGDSAPAIVNSGDENSPNLIEYRRSKSLSKSFYYDYSYPEANDMFSTVQDYPYNASANTYQVMKVWRRSDPTKYFWIMIENFRYRANDSSFVYDNNEANASVYGRMYHWAIAKECENKVMMRLPRRNADGTYTLGSYPTFGHLPTIQDINDLMEVDQIGHLSSNGTTIFDFPENGYYDVFLSGRTFDGSASPESARHSLGGWLDNTDYFYFTNRSYCDINEKAYYWLADTPSSTGSSHYPLRIYRNDGEYVAFVNASHANNYGFYVRYVFEPKQL